MKVAPELEAEIKRLRYKRGMSFDEIKRVLKVSRTMASWVCNENGFRKKYEAYNRSQRGHRKRLHAPKRAYPPAPRKVDSSINVANETTFTRRFEFTEAKPVNADKQLSVRELAAKFASNAIDRLTFTKLLRREYGVWP
jgi:transcriptional regulator with XRE-family HTH domain